jgi:polar amino acid transport system ATP-binding protein
MECIELRIVIVFQQSNLFPHLTILDNVTLVPSRILSVNRRHAEKLALQFSKGAAFGNVTAYTGQLSRRPATARGDFQRAVDEA